MVSRNKSCVFEKDFAFAKDLFPKLTYDWNAENRTWVVTGELDICDIKGNYWNSFDIAILVGESYPYCVPVVFEKSEVIPRNIDWHISEKGQCCVDADNKLIAMSRSGINFTDFLKNKVYPFFANQIYKLDTGEYAGEEYRHYADGVLQYYIEELKIPSNNSVIMILEAV
ncbi:MAG TPA: hypothetical protein VK183_02085, partial [Flavobacterium sp.]|nr:hypothetical protein [Flavobacterium sp.]